MYAKHDAHCPARRPQSRSSRPNPETAADACAHAWAQRLAADHVDLTIPWAPLAWLTTTAVREAKRLNDIERRAAPPRNERQLDAPTQARPGAPSPTGTSTPSLLERLDLVKEIPERPRRFLLRLALGYSYDEISAAEGVSHTTTQQADRARQAHSARTRADRGGRRTDARPLKEVWTPPPSPRPGAPVALASRDRFWLAAAVQALPDGHPRRIQVALMALHARDVLTGEIPGPYTDANADRFARLVIDSSDDMGAG